MPTAASREAEEAAVELAGIPRAGIRAMALSHTVIADYIRQGDRDPVIIAIAATSRTEQQQAALAEQEKLSAAERAVLEAVLTGSGLEAALAALPAAYTDEYKNEARKHARSYNAGDIQVDVTGGTIVSDGDGVHARYVLTHDRNGAISVTVADGARITGERNGIYVGSAGAAEEGNFRAQSVTVNGRVTGGTGAGVHMAGGGRLTVGRTGRIGATSGIGVLADGAGDLHATVAGRVEGDVRMAGTGALTLAVPEGGVVTGTVRDPAGLPTVVGSIGRLLYANGATVTVAATGALTGVEVDGGIEALRAEAGDLDVTVAGRVAGDLRAPSGGTLKLSVPEGGVVTGTVRDPVGLPTVTGSIGRLLYTDGATVTVAATGALTGVEAGGRTEAIRSEAGNLDVTVAGMVTGDVLGLGDGDHTVTVAQGGTVTGVIRVAASTVRVDGTVAGYVRFDRGGALTVGPDGRILAPEGEDVAVHNAGGDLVVTLQVGEDEPSGRALGRIRGDIVNAGGGAVTVVVLENGQATTCAEIGSRERFAIGMGCMGEMVGMGDAALRVYEALPSVLLGLNRLPTHRDRLSGLRSSTGTWVRIAAGGGEWRAKRSTSTGRIAYDHRGYGAQAGVDFGVGASGLWGVSAHRRMVKAKLSGRDGEIEAAGSGFGLSGAWRFGNGVYVDGQFEATWYKADLASGRRGALESEAKAKAKGFGHAVGLEAGRRFGLGPGSWREVSLTPRARLVRSNVKVDAFTDPSGRAVSLRDGGSLSGRAGVELEASGEAGRVFGSVELEREFRPDTRVEASGVGLSSKSAEMRALLALGGSRMSGEMVGMRCGASCATQRPAAAPTTMAAE